MEQWLDELEYYWNEYLETGVAHWWILWCDVMERGPLVLEDKKVA